MKKHGQFAASLHLATAYPAIRTFVAHQEGIPLPYLTDQGTVPSSLDPKDRSFTSE